MLKPGSSPGVDGIMPEHLKYACDSDLILHLSILLSACLINGVIPDSFRRGLLIPIPKKSNMDPSVPSNDRPITISVIISKVLELHILEECQGHIFNQSQFGFISGGGADIW